MVKRLPALLLGVALCGTAGAWLPASALPSPPAPVVNPMGPLVDVTAQWQEYQPSGDFCIRPDVAEFPASPATATGDDPACRFSGFGPGDTGLVEIKVATPPLCRGCRRLYVDYSRIPAGGAAGHTFFRLNSLNQSYTVGPTAHSPNIKNFTNDYLVAPPGSPNSAAAAALDRYDMAYVGDTARFAHIDVQGPYYIGPWYLNQAGQRIHGVYLDVDLPAAKKLAVSRANDIVYAAGFDAHPATCPDGLVLGPGYRDGNYLYGGCVDAFGFGALPGVDPWKEP